RAIAQPGLEADLDRFRLSGGGGEPETDGKSQRGCEFHGQFSGLMSCWAAMQLGIYHKVKAAKGGEQITDQAADIVVVTGTGQRTEKRHRAGTENHAATGMSPEGHIGPALRHPLGLAALVPLAGVVEI